MLNAAEDIQGIVDLVKNFQRLDNERDYDESSGSGPGRRKTIRNLEKSRKKTQAINTLDVAFRQRFMKMTNENGSLNGNSVKTLE